MGWSGALAGLFLRTREPCGAGAPASRDSGRTALRRHGPEGSARSRTHRPTAARNPEPNGGPHRAASSAAGTACVFEVPLSAPGVLTLRDGCAARPRPPRQASAWREASLKLSPMARRQRPDGATPETESSDDHHRALWGGRKLTQTGEPGTRRARWWAALYLHWCLGQGDGSGCNRRWGGPHRVQPEPVGRRRPDSPSRPWNPSQRRHRDDVHRARHCPALALADERGADLIVVGKHERSFLDRLLRGSVSDAARRHARCDMLIVH